MVNLTHYVQAGYPVLYLLTAEESRADLAVIDVCKKVKRNLKVWTHTDGLTSPIDDKYKDSAAADPILGLTNIIKDTEPTIYVFRDLHKFFHVPKVLRLLRDHATNFKQQKKTLIITSPVNQLPPELDRDITLIEFDLPSKEEIGKTLDFLAIQNKKAVGEINEDEKEAIVQAAMGLTLNEAENAFSKAFVEKSVDKNKLSVARLVMKEKATAVKKNGILEFFEAKEQISDIGGLENLKAWLEMRKKAFTKAAREFGLPMPRGIVLAGLPGCGKSLTAKAASNMLGLDMIRFDIGRVFAGLVGQSEANLRSALQTIDALGNVVVWIDEMEKAFAGMGKGGSQDSGVGDRVFGGIITWMNEKKGGAFIVATVNRIDNLPDELLRKGRFDEIFYVGLPNETERKEIFKIQVAKVKRNVKVLDMDELVKASKGFSGAEIEQAIVSGLYTAFSRGTDLQSDYVLSVFLNTKPLSVSRESQLKAMAKWAEENATYASKVEEGSKQAGRVLDIN